MLYVLAERSVADLLANGSQTSLELARATGLHEPSLCRLLRALSSVGVFTEESPRRFALTPLGSALKTGDPSGWRDYMMCGTWQSRAWAEFPLTVAMAYDFSGVRRLVDVGGGIGALLAAVPGLILAFKNANADRDVR